MAIRASRPVDAPVSCTTVNRRPSERGVGAFGKAPAQLGAVVVAPARDQPLGPRFERVEQRRFHPVARVYHHVGVGHLVPHPCRQVAGALGDMGIGDQQQPHGPNLTARHHTELVGAKTSITPLFSRTWNFGSGGGAVGS